MPSKPRQVIRNEVGQRVNASSEFVLRCVNAANVVWVETQQVPTVEGIVRVLYPDAPATSKAIAHVAKAVATPAYRDTCEVRGIPVGTMPGMTSAQTYAVSILTNPADKRPMATKLKAAGITQQQYRNWLKQPAFSSYIKQVGENLLGDHIADVNAMLVNKATSGDTTAMKMYYEINGRLGMNRESNQDLYMVISGLIDIITRRLAGYPGLLQEISTDIDSLMKGERPVSDLPMLEAVPIEDEPEYTPEVTEDEY
jgi:hypothetical protein